MASPLNIDERDRGNSNKDTREVELPSKIDDHDRATDATSHVAIPLENR